jgi:glyoxylase-like metal-dependent hydrolase (beta-lactamase superfamily II)
MVRSIGSVALAAAITGFVGIANAQQPAEQQPAVQQQPAQQQPAEQPTPPPAPQPPAQPVAQQPPTPPAAPPGPPQRDFSKTVITTADLGHDTYMLMGEGGNITLAVGKDAVIMVDSEFAPLHDRIKAAIEKITNLPVKYLINTHFHGDHTGGNALFHNDGATVVAQINVRNRLAAGTTNGLTGVKTPPASPDALPTDTFADRTAVKIKGRTALVVHIKNAHTDGDSYVLFRDADVLATGDIFNNGHYPNIDFANGGNIKGMIAGAETYLRLADAKTKIVPGHGPLGSKADLVTYIDMLKTARDRMVKLVKAGKSEAEVVAAKPFADLDAKWAANDQASTNFIRVVYHSLADKPMPATTMSGQ